MSKMLKRMLSLAIALIMVFGLLPWNAAVSATEAAFADAAAAVTYVNAIQGFKIADLATYKTALALLDETDNADAYTRLSTAIDKLESGYDYYDDFAVFGQFKSDMDDRTLQAGDKFGYEINTTNYDVIFGGAHAQRLTEDITSGTTTLVDASTTYPYPLNFSQFFIPVYHFHKWNHSNITEKTTSRAIADYYNNDNNSARVYTSGLDASERISEKFNWVALDTVKAGGEAGDVIDKFSVTVDNTATGTLILYHYQDQNNWAGVMNGGRGFYTYYCVNGEVLTAWVASLANSHTSSSHAIVNIFHTGTNKSLYSPDDSGNATAENGATITGSWLLQGHSQLDFVWDDDAGCYRVTVTHVEGNIKLATDVALTSTMSGELTPTKLDELWVTKLRISTGKTTNFTGTGYSSIAVQYTPHVCAAGDEYGKDETQHWSLCAKCGNQVDEAVDHSYEEGTATYDKGNQCVCGAYDDKVKEPDFLPEILGSKILKANTATAQRLRIDVDFTDLNNAIAAGSTVSEYGVIVAPLDSKVYDSTTGVNVDALKGLYGKESYTVSSTAQNDVVVSKRIMNISIKINADDYGKRIVLIAYAVVDGVTYYSENNNSNVGLENGIISTGVMRVMKAILKDTSSTGYANYYKTAAAEYYNEYAQYVEGYENADAIIELIGRYLSDGDDKIGTAHLEYVSARTAAMYVFHYSGMIYDRDGNAAPSDT